MSTNKHNTESEHGLQVLAARYRPAPSASVGETIRTAARRHPVSPQPRADTTPFAHSNGFRYIMLAASMALVGAVAYVVTMNGSGDFPQNPVARIDKNTEGIHGVSLAQIDARLASLQTQFKRRSKKRTNNAALQRWRKKNGSTQRELAKSRHLIATLKTEMNINANQT